jgi:hypothetical protein
MKRTLIVPALLLLCGCFIFGDSATYAVSVWRIACDQLRMTQDSPSSLKGAEDEKPVRTFQKPSSRPEEASP